MHQRDPQPRTGAQRDEAGRWRRIAIAALLAVGICAVTAALLIANGDRSPSAAIAGPFLL